MLCLFLLSATMVKAVVAAYKWLVCLWLQWKGTVKAKDDHVNYLILEELLLDQPHLVQCCSRVQERDSVLCRDDR